MPTKTRTTKNKSKQTKLKWWYILPVIAIVAVAGYAIVRFSFASNNEVVYEFSCRTAFNANDQDRWAFAFRGYRVDDATKSIYITTKSDGTGAKIKEFVFTGANEKNFKVAVDVSEANLNKELYIYASTNEGNKSLGSQVPNALAECKQRLTTQTGKSII